MADEIVLGFDAREPGGHDPRWDDEELRRRLLLRRDVARPLPVDLWVWPSVARIERGRSMHREERDRLGIGWNGHLFVSVARMRDSLAGRGTDPVDTVLIAVGWLWRGRFEETAGSPHPIAAEPPQPDESRSLLGYDVADGHQIGGLSNCGYRPEDVDRLREQWVPELNEHHLFRHQDAAFAFVEGTNEPVPDHAPFHVHSLYRIA
jgi:hypothetical protein